MTLEGKIYVVTGGGSGIGYQIVEDLCAEQATVCVLGRTESKLEKARNELENKFGKEVNVHSYVCDVALDLEVSDVFHKIREDLGFVYGLVNNAGINPSRSDVLSTSFQDWNSTLQVNLTGAFNCAKYAANHMKQLGEGSIVNISSIAGIIGLKDRVAYSSSKWGLVGLTKSLAVDLASMNIRSNAVCPGYVKTDLVNEYLNGLEDKEYESLVQSHPLGRLGSPQDVSNAALFLLSSKSKWITGAVIPVDGGYSAGRS